MLKGYILYTSEDAAFDELEGLNDFHRRNLHPAHDGDIDKVSFEKRGNGIHFESEDADALQYVMEFASENEDSVLAKYREGIV